MTINSLLGAGLQGLQQSQQNINTAATEIAQVSTTRPQQSTADLAEPLIEMTLEQQVFDASAKVVTTADEMVGTLLDTSA
ncbi:MAG: hypothetical protein CL693_14200 [Cellvibrionaceae bacterium]|nr:hypothetical protein [Cellvibrionaceae bacterium]|tara:strand:- start:1269 stop:1508 length:240 start_codon:yes stop_codon:yes gene_type:complete